MEAIAHTLAYDAAVVGDRRLPSELLAMITIPALVVYGEETSPFMRGAAQAVAEALPGATLAGLPGQDHGIDPEATAAAIRAFVVAG
jgi:pimeloyl-ACP methyl ester carboxylesterase